MRKLLHQYYKKISILSDRRCHCIFRSACGCCWWYTPYRNTNIIIWNSLLSFEQDMASRRTRFQKLANQIGASRESPEVLKLQFDEATESYSNSLDRLASSILRGHFPDD